MSATIHEIPAVVGSFALVRLENLRASLVALGIDPEVAAAMTLPEASGLYARLTGGEG